MPVYEPAFLRTASKPAAKADLALALAFSTDEVFQIQEREASDDWSAVFFISL